MNHRLLPPNATALERHLEATLHQALDLPVPIDTLWDPWRCQGACLPWLAWALSVDQWQSDWPENTQRQVIAHSITVHRQKGTACAMQAALAALDVNIVLREWFDTSGPPHTFTVQALAQLIPGQSGPILDQALYHTIRTLVDATKPARAHYQLHVGAQFPCALGLGVAVQPWQLKRLTMEIL